MSCDNSWRRRVVSYQWYFRRCLGDDTCDSQYVQYHLSSPHTGTDRNDEVVGQTSRILQKNNMMIHHSIGFKPDHQLYNKVSKPLRFTAAELWNPEDAPADIDRVLRECVVNRLPVYIFFPLDLSAEQVPADRLKERIDLSFPSNVANETAALQAISQKLSESKQPALFVDYLTCLYSRDSARVLADKLKIPVFSAIMSKGVIDEDHPNYVGVYNGGLNFPGISEAMNASDLIIALGWWPADTNTSFFSRNMPEDRRITMANDHVVVWKSHAQIHM